MFDRTIARDTVLILTLSFLALLVHGYHTGIEDEAIYLPAIKKLLNPSMYKSDAIFFIAQTKFTLFDELIAFLASITKASVAYVLFPLHFLSIVLTLTACLQLARLCFHEQHAQWAAVTMIAALLTIPVTGTALYIMDQHLHPRSLSTAAVLFAIVNTLRKRYATAAFLFIAGGLLHIQMTFYGFIFTAFLVLKLPWGKDAKPATHLLPGIYAAPQMTEDMWNRIRATRVHHYPLRWHWYEWLGIVAPIALLFSYSTIKSPWVSPTFRRLSRRMAICGALAAALAVALTIPPQLQKVANLQPMRGFQLLYLLFFLLTGGLIGHWVLRNKAIRWMIIFVPLSLGMFIAQRNEFPASPHIELPGKTTDNSWLKAFEWIKENTPQDALFALDPYYLKRPGEDYHGFRGLAERSMMADYVKDVAVAALSVTARTIGANRDSATSGVPEVWCAHMAALSGWENFKIEDFRRLKEQFGVTWVILEKPGVDGLICPYENDQLKVCRID